MIQKFEITGPYFKTDRGEKVHVELSGNHEKIEKLTEEIQKKAKEWDWKIE